MRKAELDDMLLPFERWIGQLVREKMDHIVRGYDQPGGSYMVFFLSCYPIILTIYLSWTEE